MVYMEVAPTQTRSSPNKMSRPSGSFTPEKFSAINQANASRVHIKPLGNSQRLHQHQLSVESLWISCFDFFSFFSGSILISQLDEVSWVIFTKISAIAFSFFTSMTSCLLRICSGIHSIFSLSVFDARNKTSSLTSTFHLLKGSGVFFSSGGASLNQVVSEIVIEQ